MSEREAADLARGRARGVSLWLQPQGPLRDRLSGVIARLAARFGGPVFEPHVTLLAGLTGDEPDVLARAQSLAGELRPFALRLERVARRDEYFRAVFVEAIGGEPLREAHSAACRAFSHRPTGGWGRRRPEFSDGAPMGPAPDSLRRWNPTGPFEPHLSLAYGRLDPAAAEAAGREVSNEVQGRFEAGTLHVVRTEGRVEAWQELAVLEFGPR